MKRPAKSTQNPRSLNTIFSSPEIKLAFKDAIEDYQLQRLQKEDKHEAIAAVPKLLLVESSRYNLENISKEIDATVRSASEGWDALFNMPNEEASTLAEEVDKRKNQDPFTQHVTQDPALFTAEYGIAMLAGVVRRLFQTVRDTNHQYVDFLLMQMLRLDESLRKFRTKMGLTVLEAESQKQRHLKLLHNHGSHLPTVTLLGRSIIRGLFGPKNSSVSVQKTKKKLNQKQLNGWTTQYRDQILRIIRLQLSFTRYEAEDKDSALKKSIIEKQKRLVSGLSSIYQGSRRYTKFFGLLLFAADAVTSAAEISATGTGLVFGLPLLPVLLYAVSRAFSKKPSEKALKKQLILESSITTIAINKTFDVFDDMLKAQLSCFDRIIKPFHRQIPGTTIGNGLFANMNVVPSDQSYISLHKFRRCTVSAISNVVSGVMLVQSVYRPLMLFTQYLGSGALVGPLAVPITLGIGLGIGLVMMIYGVSAIINAKKPSQQLKDSMTKLSELEQRNCYLEQRIQKIYHDMKQRPDVTPELLSAFKPLTCDMSERFYSRFDTTPATHLTYTKKSLNRVWFGVMGAAMGASLTKIIFGVGGMIAISNPIAFIALLVVSGVVLGAFKAYEYHSRKMDHNEKSRTKHIVTRLHGAKKYNKFLKKQFVHKAKMINAFAKASSSVDFNDCKTGFAVSR